MKPENNFIGILGLANRSTIFYLSTLNRFYQNNYDENHTFPCIVKNIDFNTLNPFLPNQFKTLVPTLQTYLDSFKLLPVHTVLIPNVTLHETFDRCHTNLFCIHPLELAVSYLKKKDINKVTVFGSKYTMESAYISSYFLPHDIEVLKPSAEDSIQIDNLRKKLYNNNELQEDILNYISLVKTYSKSSFVLISCSELSILHPHIQKIETVLDMAMLQIKYAIDQQLNNNQK